MSESKVQRMTLLDRLRVIAPKSIAELERKAASDDPIASEFARAVLADCAAKQAQKKPEGLG